MTGSTSHLIIDHLQAIRASIESAETEIEAIIEILDRIVSRINLTD